MDHLVVLGCIARPQRRSLQEAVWHAVLLLSEILSGVNLRVKI